MSDPLEGNLDAVFDKIKEVRELLSMSARKAIEESK